MGRPRIEIDWPLVDNLCAIHCTGPEIASVLGVSEDTMTRACKREKKLTFADYIRQKSLKGKASLRRQMWKLAESGNAVMLIFIAKNWLGMKSEPDANPLAEIDSSDIELKLIDDAEIGIDDE